jgi:diguanylate cyclase (GGDEF)-like protein
VHQVDSASLYFAAAGLILVLTPLESAFSLAFEDGLTGLPARRALEESLRHMGRTWAVAMVDIDHFKKLNDRHGHEVGDQVLRMVARELEKLGGGGRAFRYGGEEFTLLFSACSAEEAADHADELRRRIAERRFAVRSPLRPKKKQQGRSPAGGDKHLRVKVSIGVAERSERLTTPEQVIKAADKALYRSKKAGRNRVTVGK